MWTATRLRSNRGRRSLGSTVASRWTNNACLVTVWEMRTREIGGKSSPPLSTKTSTNWSRAERDKDDGEGQEWEEVEGEENVG